MQIPLTMTTVIGFETSDFIYGCHGQSDFTRKTTVKNVILHPTKDVKKCIVFCNGWMVNKKKHKFTILFEMIFLSTWDVQLGLYFRYSFIEDFL